jgi:hypothetical protein
MQLKWSEFALEEYGSQLFYLALENEELPLKLKSCWKLP